MVADIKPRQRFSTFHCERGERDPRRRYVPTPSVEMGDRLGHSLQSVGIEPVDCAWAFASCLIQVMGKDAHNDEGTALRSEGSTFNHGQNRWVHTQLETRGARPSARFQTRPLGVIAWADSFEGANTILGCFGITMSKVLDHFGNVDPMERKVFDLPTIIRALAPELLSTEETECRMTA